MKKFGFLVATLVSVFLVTSAFAAPSAKFTAEVSEVTLINWTEDDVLSDMILSASIKTPNKKDLLIGVSLETGLYTKTTVKSMNGVLDTQSAVAGISVVVKVDGVEAYPGAVIFDKRTQTLSAKLGGILSGCTDADGDGHITIDECTLLPEEIELILDTMGAHHFNFVAANLEPGDHIVEVWASIDVGASTTATAKALVGKGSLTVEEVRATNSPDGISIIFAE